MKKRLLLLSGVAVILAAFIFFLPKREQTKPIQTGTVREGMIYGGQNCIMYQDLLYWEQSIYENPKLDQMELVGVVEKTADAIPEHNFESAVTAVGSEIYYTDNNPGMLVVKEGDFYYRFSLQDNS